MTFHDIAAEEREDSEDQGGYERDCVRRDLEPLQVFDQLNRDQKSELVESVWDWTHHWDWDRPDGEMRRDGFAEWKRSRKHVQRLAGCLNKARQSLVQLQQSAAVFSQSLTAPSKLRAQRVDFAKLVTKRTTAALALLTLSVASSSKQRKPPRRRGRRPEPHAHREDLFAFFHDRCGLSKSEAYVRVGTIEKHFLDTGVAVLRTSLGRDQPKGAEAIRKHIERKRRSAARK